jgi:hypothetical protein
MLRQYLKKHKENICPIVENSPNLVTLHRTTTK